MAAHCASYGAQGAPHRAHSISPCPPPSLRARKAQARLVGAVSRALGGPAVGGAHLQDAHDGGLVLADGLQDVGDEREPSQCLERQVLGVRLLHGGGRQWRLAARSQGWGLHLAQRPQRQVLGMVRMLS